MTHLGSRVSALVDGCLPPDEEERCWNHVHACHACRDLVENEGWVKTQLAQLSLGQSETSDDFKTSLIGRCSSLSPASGSGSSLMPAPFPTSHHRPRRGLVAIGGGAASACVVGVLALGVAQSPRVEPRPPATDLSRPAGPTAPASTTVNVLDDRAARGPVSPSRTPLAERLVAIREKIVP